MDKKNPAGFDDIEFQLRRTMAINVIPHFKMCTMDFKYLWKRLIFLIKKRNQQY